MSTLYQIRNEHIALLQEVEQAGGELSPEIEEALSFTLEEFQQKAVSVGYVIKHFEDDTATIDAEIERLTTLKERATKQREFLKQRLSDAMQEFGFENITTPTLTLSFRKSESVEITDEATIPGQYMVVKVTHTPDKKHIKEALKRDIFGVPGATLVIKQHLQIK